MAKVPPAGTPGNRNPFGKYEVAPASAPQEAPPAGPHHAVCVAVVDLGSHPTEVKDQTGAVSTRVYRRCYLGFELAALAPGSGAPYVLGRAFNVAFSKTAALRKFLESWKGRTLQEREPIDLRDLLSQPATLIVKHRPGQSRTFATIDSVALPMAGAVGRPLVHRPVFFAIGDGPIPDLSWVPWAYHEPLGRACPLSVVIASSPEWKALHPQVGGAPAGGEASDPPF
jgi:hypothetical protein